MVAIRCSICPRQLHQQPAYVSGPPDISGRVRQLPICRTCFRRVQQLFPWLREQARNDGAADKVSPHDGTPPGRPSIPAP
jgi:hypothetical protein